MQADGGPSDGSKLSGHFSIDGRAWGEVLYKHVSSSIGPTEKANIRRKNEPMGVQISWLLKREVSQ